MVWIAFPEGSDKEMYSQSFLFEPFYLYNT
jgi:hypothetical protein